MMPRCHASHVLSCWRAFGTVQHSTASHPRSCSLRYVGCRGSREAARRAGSWARPPSLRESYFAAPRDLLVLTPAEEYDNNKPRTVRLYLRDTGYVNAFSGHSPDDVLTDLDYEAECAQVAAFDHTMRLAFSMTAASRADDTVAASGAHRSDTGAVTPPRSTSCSSVSIVPFRSPSLCA